MVRVRERSGRSLPERLRKKRPPREGVLERWASKQAKKLRLKFWKLQFISNKGAPDRLVVGTQKRQAYVEFKRSEKHELSALQRETHEDLRQRGQIVYVVHSKEQVKEVFHWLVRGKAPPRLSANGRPRLSAKAQTWYSATTGAGKN